MPSLLRPFCVLFKMLHFHIIGIIRNHTIRSPGTTCSTMTASKMYVLPLPASSCSVLCTARQLGRRRHCQNAVRTAYEKRARGFCSQKSSDQASSKARVAASAGGIGSTMLAGLKKAFTKVVSRSPL